MKKGLLMFLVLCLGLFLSAGISSAQKYPAKAVEFIAPANPGGAGI